MRSRSYRESGSARRRIICSRLFRSGRQRRTVPRTVGPDPDVSLLGAVFMLRRGQDVCSASSKKRPSRRPRIRDLLRTPSRGALTLRTFPVWFALGVRALVMTWVSGGNLPPLLSAASLLHGRGHEVTVLGSGETCDAARRLGLGATRYRRTPDPDSRVDFEAQADLMMATMAGAEIALDARDALAELRPDLAIVDCMLPAAIAAARAMGTPTASLVHFLYGLARNRMLRAGGGWTTDLRGLAATHRMLGLAAASDGLSAWEAPELLLVTAPHWLDVDCHAPANVLYAGPLGVRVRPPRPVGAGERPRVLLTFSTTVMAGQQALIERVCDAVVGLDVDAVLTLGRAVDREALRVPDGVDAVAYADHDRLMPTCAAVVSHGGLGTVLRALAHGVPQLLLPLGRDQAFNAGRVEQLEAGIRLATDAPPERIRIGLDELLADPRFRAAAALAARRVAADEPDRTAGQALERAAHR
jgi:UDP:flavonoid glycosyltransferase YjiC (YdhE family)